MIPDLLLYLAGMLIVIGAIFSFLAALGLLRFPDLFTRLHAATKAGGLGVGLVFIAVVFVSFDFGVAIRALLGALFVLLTSPIAAHLLARAALKSGILSLGITNTGEIDTSRKLRT